MMLRKALGLGLAVASTMAVAGSAEHVPGELIVKLKSNANKSAFNALASNGVNVQRTIETSGGELFVVKFDESQKGGIESVQNMVQAMEEVEYAEPNFIYRIVKPIKEKDLISEILDIEPQGVYYTPADPKFSQLWGLNNTGSNAPAGDRGVAGADVGAMKAWEITQGSRAVRVAVIDTGIDYNHPDLADQMWTNEAELNGQPGVDDDGNGYIDDIHGYDFANNDGDPKDGHSHGTHCAGTIGASHNAIGVAGVMSEVEFVAVKFLTDAGSGTTEGAIKSIDYATKMGVDIMSNSWGGGGRSEALKEAIERANAAGIVFTAAAGNSSTDNDARPHYPSNYEVDNVISVAATTAADELASFSCFGRRTVHIGAPGHKILSTVKNGGYESYSGTSMATPHVTGVVGLLIANEGRLNPLEVRERVMRTSDPVAALRGKTINGGRINAFNLLTNTIPDRQEPDPSKWESVSVDVWETSHPYADNANEVRTFKVEGAKFIRLNVSKFELEDRYDYLEVRDAQGNLVEKISGKGENHEGFYAAGDSITVTFISDRSVNKWGFEISDVSVQY
ncbi:S8 family serine peptidase [Bacteriovorax sp. Seq25_V]|uniref:S8 family serine peptidase n=1 Tax=Bacteriovorax sp. Seq25_V TaxID=1201288 RepID=UPI000696F1AC|nr:S8 family serine peptidase [Bacteriovorax sp. Seq25_V]